MIRTSGIMHFYVAISKIFFVTIMSLPFLCEVPGEIFVRGSENIFCEVHAKAGLDNILYTSETCYSASVLLQRENMWLWQPVSLISQYLSSFLPSFRENERWMEFQKAERRSGRHNNGQLPVTISCCNVKTHVNIVYKHIFFIAVNLHVLYCPCPNCSCHRILCHTSFLVPCCHLALILWLCIFIIAKVLDNFGRGTWLGHKIAHSKHHAFLCHNKCQFLVSLIFCLCCFVSSVSNGTVLLRSLEHFY